MGLHYSIISCKNLVVNFEFLWVLITSKMCQWIQTFKRLRLIFHSKILKTFTWHVSVKRRFLPEQLQNDNYIIFLFIFWFLFVFILSFCVWYFYVVCYFIFVFCFFHFLFNFLYEDDNNDKIKVQRSKIGLK